jgi:hypothetical protein
MDRYEKNKRIVRAQEDCVWTLENICKAIEWGSGFTDAEIMATIRKNSSEYKKTIAIAKGKC